MAENKLLKQLSTRPTRYLDYYFLEAKAASVANRFVGEVRTCVHIMCTVHMFMGVYAVFFVLITEKYCVYTKCYVCIYYILYYLFSAYTYRNTTLYCNTSIFCIFMSHVYTMYNVYRSSGRSSSANNNKGNSKQWQNAGKGITMVWVIQCMPIQQIVCVLILCFCYT